MTQVPKSVAVLGGGPAGLAAAHELSASGVDVTVFERAPWVGGLSMTWEHEGFRFDLGGHRWFTKKDWLHNWFLELMEGELVTVNRVSRIYFDGRYFHYPVRLGNVLLEAGPINSVHAVLSYVKSSLTSLVVPRPVENIEEAYIQQFGPKLYRMFFKQYTEKVWGRECTQLSAEWVAQRTKGLSVWQTVTQSIAPQKQRIESLVDQFVYPRLGYQRISERMKSAIETRGGRVQLESTVIGVDAQAGGVVVRYRDVAGEEHEASFDHAISTIPLGRLVAILKPQAPSTVRAAAMGLEFRSLVTANVMLDRERVTDDTWLYIHDRAIGFARIHEPRNWSEAMAPPGKTSICAEWFCSEGDEIWQMSDQEIVDRTIGHLADDLHFVERGEMIEGIALRARSAYPVYALDYQQRLDTIKAHLARHASRLSIAGRGGAFRYNNADHSIEVGLLVAKNLLGGQYDVDGVNAEQQYLEEKIVEQR